MSEGKTEIERQTLAMRLSAGNATQEERDRALAELLLSMWGEEQLNNHIDQRIAVMCKECKGSSWQPVIIELIRCKLFWGFAITALTIGGSSLVQSLATALTKLF